MRDFVIYYVESNVVCMIVLGLLLLINPWWKEINHLFDVIGCMLLYSSVVGIVRLIFLWPIKGE